MDVFDHRGNKTCDYVLLRSEQVKSFLLVTFARGLIVLTACWNRLDDFCQVRLNLCHTERGSNHPEGAPGAGSVDSSHQSTFVTPRRGCEGCLGTKEPSPSASSIMTQISAS